MKSGLLYLMAALIAVSACGIKRPLIRPKDIPAYEEKRARKMEKFAPKTPTPTDTPDPGSFQPGGASLRDSMTPMPRVEQQ